MHEFCLHGILCKIRFTPLAVRISSHRCTYKAWRALKNLESLSTALRATLTLLSCSPDFPCPSISWNTLAKHKPILYRQLRRTENRQTCCTIRVSLINLCTIELYLTNFLIQFCWKLISKVGSSVSVKDNLISFFFRCKPRRVTTLREE